MAQTMAEYLIEQGEERGEAQAKRDAVSGSLSLTNVLYFRDTANARS